jgi:hypothetical protein
MSGILFPTGARWHLSKPMTDRTIAVIFLLCCAFALQAARAAPIVDCSVLDPRVEVSKATEGKIQGSADTLYKIAKAEGKVEGKVETAAKNIQNNVAQSEKSNVQNRLLYVFCEMIAKDSSIPAERKFELYKVVLDRFAPASNGTTNVPAKPPKPLDSDEQAKQVKQAAADRAAAERAAKRAAADRTAIEKMLADRKKEEIAAAKQAALAAADAERAKRERPAAEAKAAEERAVAKQTAAETIKAESLMKTFGALQTGRPLVFHTTRWFQGLKDLQFSFRLENDNLILSKVRFSLDLDDPGVREYKEAIGRGSRFALYFGLYSWTAKRYLSIKSICCWSEVA